MTQAHAPKLISAEILEGERRLNLRWSDGSAWTFAAPWLLDEAPEARLAASGQRLHGWAELTQPLPIRVDRIEGDELILTLGEASRRFSATALWRAAPSVAPDSAAAELWPTPGETVTAAPIPYADYLSSDAGLRETLARVRATGLARLSGVGAVAGEVERVVARFGHVRETNYGRLFDVRAQAQAVHLAYTRRGLDLHTDNPYREPPPTLQLLHALVADANGGETLFVDGFAHAAALAEADPEAFARLAEEAVDFAFRGADGEVWTARSPLIRLDPEGRVESLRVNHRSMRAPRLPVERTELWYDAYRNLMARLHAPQAALALHLQPGDLVMFDNSRILHGRRAYGGDAGERWLQGGYADLDGLRATLARLETGEIEHV